ncbi:helix-turn-helix domain-containing protein [Sneathiella limimaris]|uniref:helix-turn-helix domain-containing protein n=1 Tax=Sneathiella limimaris TaxID=1964213 RepID=UPI00146EE23B|nr:helix-turn-helix transcriptional regulator [Sneathiella limimaris]
MDKRERAWTFRDRLLSRMQASKLNQSELARRCGVDRSTIAQLLNEESTRLPNAHLAAECANALGVSLDWLLGLTERSETAADLLQVSINLTEAARTPTDAQLRDWFREAKGHKIRHVPATLPDIIKTDAVMQFEYSAFLTKTPEQAAKTTSDHMKWVQQPGSDYEICIPKDMLHSLIRGDGYWTGLSKTAREEQVEHIIQYCRNFYPSVRIYVYDPKVVFSAPITIFGPLLAVIYIGQYYMVFRENRQIQALTQHFDNLVKESEIDARSVSEHIEDILKANTV